MWENTNLHRFAGEQAKIYYLAGCVSIFPCLVEIHPALSRLRDKEKETAFHPERHKSLENLITAWFAVQSKL